jgi:hypothetical protein
VTRHVGLRLQVLIELGVQHLLGQRFLDLLSSPSDEKTAFGLTLQLFDHLPS